MSDDLRLRQICLVAPALEPVVGDIAGILGLEVCHRDPAVAVYGLENALLPIGRSFLEVVAPTRRDTAARRFLERSAGHGGYMVIFDCSDPGGRARHAEEIGVRVANVIRYATYHGVQLHPRDCRAAMIEFNHTVGGSDLDGPYHPAGQNWLAAVRTSQAVRLLEAEIESPAPAELAGHWSAITQLPASQAGDEARLVTRNGAVRFVRVAEGRPECLGGLRIAARDVEAALAEASRRGYKVEHSAFHLGGVYFRLQPVNSPDSSG